MKSLVAVLLLSTVVVAQEKSCVSVVTTGGAGSGTVVASDGKVSYILTNRHVISEAKKVWVIHDKKRYTATFVKSHPQVDLALVRVDGLVAEAVELASAELQVGDEVKHWGRATQYQEGKCVAYTQFATSDGKVNNCDYFSVPGDSGCGVFNKDGKLVAVHYCRIGDPENDNATGGSVRLTHIKEFLKELGK